MGIRRNPDRGTDVLTSTAAMQAGNTTSNHRLALLLLPTPAGGTRLAADGGFGGLTARSLAVRDMLTLPRIATHLTETPWPGLMNSRLIATLDRLFADLMSDGWVDTLGAESWRRLDDLDVTHGD